jgi:hypothetical protein
MTVASVTRRTERIETIAQVLILILIAGMAGAASFTHVHDWTMRNAPVGTGTWFGWANAVISELTPGAAGIEIRRRKRHNGKTGYPMAVLIAAVVLSLTAQVAEARPGPAGWTAATVPALAFLALTKLILTSTGIPPEPAPEPAQQPAAPIGTLPAITARDTATASAPAEIPTGQLLISARMIAFGYQQETGTPITPGELAIRLDIPPALADSLHTALTSGETNPPQAVTAVNGTARNRP